MSHHQAHAARLALAALDYADDDETAELTAIPRVDLEQVALALADMTARLADAHHGGADNARALLERLRDAATEAADAERALLPPTITTTTGDTTS
jgi:hypothetical protein